MIEYLRQIACHFRTSFNSTVDYRRAAPVHLTVGLKVLVLVLTW